MSRPTFSGVLTAIVTPMRGGHLDFASLDRLVDDQVRGGVDGLVAVGTTGESPTLDHDEHVAVIEATVRAAAGRVPVYAGTGSNSTAEAIDLVRRADAVGAAGHLQVAPYYNKPTPEGLFRHFDAVASATDRPILLYSIPSRCGIEIDVPTVERLCARHPHVVGIKEAGGSCDRVDRLREALGDRLEILSGDDGLTLPFVALGAIGVVSVASNLVPAEVGRLVAAARAGRADEARATHERLRPLFRALFVESNPVPAKHALARMGLLASDEVRPPLAPLSDRGRAVLDPVLAALGLVR